MNASNKFTIVEVLSYVDSDMVRVLPRDHTTIVEAEKSQDTMRTDSQSTGGKAQMILYDQMGSGIVPRELGTIQQVPIACASATGPQMQIQINVPLKSLNRLMHEIITHKELPMEIHNVGDPIEQLQDKGNDESTAGNFKVIARKGDLSPRISGRNGMKGKKQAPPMDQHPPIRILPKRAASTTRR